MVNGEWLILVVLYSRLTTHDSRSTVTSQKRDQKTSDSKKNVFHICLVLFGDKMVYVLLLPY